MHYFSNQDKLLSGAHTSPVLRAQIALFCTWAEIARYEDLETAAAHLDEYERWLIGWGFPARAARVQIEALGRRLESALY